MFTERLNQRKEKILELENRRKVFEIVKKYSGCHFREIERRSSIPYGTLKYHLNFLVKRGLLICKKEDNSLRYFPSDFHAENVELLSILRQNNLRKIILFILTNKNCGHEDIVRFMKLSPSTVSWHLKKLISRGVIVASRNGRKTFYVVSTDREEIMKLLITYQRSFLDSLVDRVVEMWEVR